MELEIAMAFVMENMSIDSDSVGVGVDVGDEDGDQDADENGDQDE